MLVCCECVCSFINLRHVLDVGRRVDILLVHIESVTLILRFQHSDCGVWVFDIEASIIFGIAIQMHINCFLRFNNIDR